MRFKVNPRQKRLFDPFEAIFSKVGYRRIRSGWQEVFRRSVLHLMPVGTIEGKFDPCMGAPTKELYSMAGLLLIMEFMNWTKEEAVDAYMFRADIQYALNLEPVKQSLSVRTIERYQRIFEEFDLAAKVMNDITDSLARELELDISKQRLDSTHVFSDMATFGRTRLMGVTIKRFLTQVKRHNHNSYAALPEELRIRYKRSARRLFADAKKEVRQLLRQQVAEDLHLLIERFADDTEFSSRTTYKMLVEVFEDQCEIQEERVEVKKKTGGDVIQNPSDPEATYDGHKGPGYQAQICETCSEENEVQLITGAKVETAVENDQEAVAPVLEDLEDRGLLPETLLADAAYGTDSNVVDAEKRGVDLQSPVPGRTTGNASDEGTFSLNVDDFVVDPATETIVRCPAGHEPASSVHDPETGKTTTIMPIGACSGCEFSSECPISMTKGNYRLLHTPKGRRLAERRREQATEPFRELYAKRSGGESVNSGLKRRMGLGRLRVRGMRRVAYAVYMRIAGWNILRAASSSKLQSKLAQMRVEAQTQGGKLISEVVSALTRAILLFWRPKAVKTTRTALLPRSHYMGLGLVTIAA
jgi:hypothetical protein